MNIRPAGLPLLAAGCLVLSLASARTQEDTDAPRGAGEPTAEAVLGIVDRAQELLRGIEPASKNSSTREEWKVMDLPGGTVRWGNFVRPDRISALVNVTQAGEESDLDPLRHDLCYFEWEDDRWNFRQYLGNASDLSVNYRDDHPSVFLRGSFRTGRYDGEYVSWFFNEKSGRFARTGFETWGPFYLVGNHLVTERGFERLGHDSTWWIYEYRDGRKGALVCRFHLTDEGDFDVTCRDAATGDWRSWIFSASSDDPSRMDVSLVTDLTRGEAGEPEADPDRPRSQGSIDSSADSDQVFALLSGLPSSILEERWDADRPASSSVRPPRWDIRGDAEIVERLGGRSAGTAADENRARVLDVLREVKPTGRPPASATIARGDVRGIWGRLFGGANVHALIARDMADEGSGDGQATLYQLRWDGKEWAIVEELGKVSPDVTSTGAPAWIVRSHGDPAEYFVIGQQDRNIIENCLSWRYDPGTRRLVSTGWPRIKLPSLAGDAITLVSRDLFRAGNPFISESYRYRGGRPGAFLGSVITDFTEENLLRATLTAPQKNSGRQVTWRVWKQSGDHLPQNDIYAICRDETGGQGAFRTDATIEFDWDDDFAPDDAARYIWWRLTGTGVDSYLGEWSDGPDKLPRMPKSVKVTGLPEAVELFTWPGK